MAIVDSTTYEAPGRSGSPVELQERYDNFKGQALIDAAATADTARAANDEQTLKRFAGNKSALMRRALSGPV
jgi:hypothetical protein